MKYQLKNIAGETRTIAGVDVADQGYLVFVDETSLSGNLVGALMADVSTITQMFNAAELEYYENNILMTQENYIWTINGMQPLASSLENKWEFLAQTLSSQPSTVSGNEYFEVESFSSGWKKMTSRVQLRQERIDAPVVIILGTVDYVNSNGLVVGQVTSDWFNVEYNVKGSGDGLTCSVSFEWEATYDD